MQRHEPRELGRPGRQPFIYLGAAAVELLQQGGQPLDHLVFEMRDPGVEGPGNVVVARAERRIEHRGPVREGIGQGLAPVRQEPLDLAATLVEAQGHLPAALVEDLTEFVSERRKRIRHRPAAGVEACLDPVQRPVEHGSYTLGPTVDPIFEGYNLAVQEFPCLASAGAESLDESAALGHEERVHLGEMLVDAPCEIVDVAGDTVAVRTAELGEGDLDSPRAILKFSRQAVGLSRDAVRQSGSRLQHGRLERAEPHCHALVQAVAMRADGRDRFAGRVFETSVKRAGAHAEV